MSAPALSLAANANLERVLRVEQEANARRILTIRALMGLVGSALFLAMPSPPEHAAVIAVSTYGTYTYFVVGTALLVLARLVPRTLLATTYAVALVDVPLLTFIHYTQTTAMPEAPWVNVPANVGMMVALITLSALSLSWVVIVTTATAAAVSIFLVSGHGGFDPLPRALLIILAPGVAMTCSSLVSRLRRLVRESRERDLLGKYILGERIGSGGMAEVFAATYSPEGGFERRVAIKRILPSFANNPDAVLLFRREAELGASLAHPNLVPARPRLAHRPAPATHSPRREPAQRAAVEGWRRKAV